jgi:polyether ionophore transport system permease protein
MTQLTGAGTLARFAARRDRRLIAGCVIALVLVVFASSSSLKSLYPTAADRAKVAATLEDNAAVIALRGPARGLDSIGGLIAFQLGANGAVAVALMSLLLTGRYTRTEEERGRTELVRAAAVGRYAPPAAAVALVAGIDLVTGAGVTAALLAVGQPFAGSLALGASFAATGIVFAAVAAVAAQVTESPRAAHGIAAATLGVAYVLRAAGDVGNGALSWLSPIGWGQATHPFTGERWWPLVLSLAASVALLAVAFRLLERRDLGAGLVPPRPGPPVAGSRLATPLGFAVRLQRGSLIGWSVGLFLLGATYGAVGADAGDLLDTSSQLEDFFDRGGQGIVDAFLATTLLLAALVVAGFAIGAVLRLRGEETSGRAEPVLATAIGRRRWASGHLAVAFGGAALVLLATGLGAGLAYTARGGGAEQIPRLALAALGQLPAVCVLAGVAIAGFGLGGRLAMVAWFALAACVLIALVGPLLNLPAAVMDVSPFTHSPSLPGGSPAVGTLVALTAVAAALVAVGLTALGRRDISAGS